MTRQSRTMALGLVTCAILSMTGGCGSGPSSSSVSPSASQGTTGSLSLRITPSDTHSRTELLLEGVTSVTVQVLDASTGADVITPVSVPVSGGSEVAQTLTGISLGQRIVHVDAFSSGAIVGDADTSAFPVVAGNNTAPPLSISGFTLVVQAQPAATQTGALLKPVEVAIEDHASKVVTLSNAAVTVALGNNPGDSTLSGTTSVDALNGVATFNGLSLNNPASGYTLVATATGMSSVTTGPFNILAAVAGDPNSVAFAPNGKFLYLTNLGSRSVQGFAINQTNGALTPIAGSPFFASNGTAIASPRVVVLSPDGRFVFVTDASLSKVFVFAADAATGALSEVTGSPFACGFNAAGAAVDRSSHFLYVSNFAAATLSGFAIGATGFLTPLAGFDGSNGVGNGVFGIVFSPDNSHVYVASSVANIVSDFTFNSVTGLPTLVGSTATFSPELIAVDPSGSFLYTADFSSPTTAAFTIAPGNGALTPTSPPTFQAGNVPVQPVVDASGKFVYEVNKGSSDLTAYSIGTGGVLNSLSTTPLAPGTGPLGVATQNVNGVEYLYTANTTSSDVSAFSINTATGALIPIPGQPFHD